MNGLQRRNSRASLNSPTSKSHVSEEFLDIDFEEMKDCTVSDVISFLKSSFRVEVFAKAENMLRLREGKLVTEKEEMKRNLNRLELEYRGRHEDLERELELCQRQCSELEERNRKAEEDLNNSTREAEGRRSLLDAKLGVMEVEKHAVEGELEKYKRRCTKLEVRLTCLEEDLRVTCEREQRREQMITGLEEAIKKKENELQEKFIQLNALKVEKRDLECGKRRAENEIAEFKSRCRELEARVLQLEGENSCSRKKMKVASVELFDGVCSEENGKKGSCKPVGGRNGREYLSGHRDLKDKLPNSNQVIHAFATVACHSPVRERCVLNAEADPPSIRMPSGSLRHVEVDNMTDCLLTKEQNRSQVRMQLSIKDDEISYGKVMPTVTGGTKLGFAEEVILVSESDDEEATPTSNFNSEYIETSRVLSRHISGEMSDNRRERSAPEFLKRKSEHKSKDAASENDGSYEESFTPSSTTGKLFSKVITSDDEDDIPIAQLRMKNLKEVYVVTENPSTPFAFQSRVAPNISSGSDRVEKHITPSRRCLVPPQQCEETKCGMKETSPCYMPGQKLSPKTGNLILEMTENPYQMQEKVEYTELDGDGESLGGIIKGSACSESEGDSTGDSEDETGNESLGEFLEKMRRNKESKKWEYEADMLSSLSKDPLLCMKAVCAIYRRQVSEEKAVQGSLYINNRGFDEFDVLKGSDLAMYLMNGASCGPLKKSVEELEKHDSGAVEYCSHLVSRYSRQLFEIYQNKEDGFFP